MAELSQETQEIINRLKAEGDLIRNTGTNSIKATNIKLESMVGLMTSVERNINQQTAWMREGLGLQQELRDAGKEALEKQNTQEQLDEITPTQKEPGAGKAKKDTSGDGALKNIAQTISKGLTLKKLAVAGLVGFAGYNLFKGYFDEANDGAWTKMEDSVGLLGPKLADLAKIDFATKFSEFETSMTEFKTSFSNLNTTISELNTKIQAVLDISWGDIATVVLGGLSTFGVAMAVLRNRITQMGQDLKDGMRTRNGQTWVQRALGIGRKIDDAVPPSGGRGTINETTGARRAATNGARPGAVVTTPASRAQTRIDVTNSAAGQRSGLQMRGKQLVNSSGQFVSDADALRIMENTLDPKYSKIFKRLTVLFKAVGIAFAIYSMWQIYTVLSSDMTDDQKMEALAPILGGIIGGVGGVAIGAAIGSIPPLTGWGTLLLGAIGGIAGALAGEALGFYVAKWAFAVEPTAADKAQMTVRPRPTSQGGRNRLQTRWDDSFGNTHNQDGTPMTQITPISGGRGSRNEMRAERKNYVLKRDARVLDALIEAEINGTQPPSDIQQEIKSLEDYLNIDYAPGSLSKRLGTLSSSAVSGGTTVINAQTIAPSPVTINNGGSSVKQVSFNGGGGNGGPSLLPYGLTGSIA